MLTYRQDGEKWRIDMKKWFSMELTRIEWTDIRPILKPILEELECKYETSECGMMVHVEVYCTPDTADTINAEIDNL